MIPSKNWHYQQKISVYDLSFPKGKLILLDLSSIDVNKMPDKWREFVKPSSAGFLNNWK